MPGLACIRDPWRVHLFNPPDLRGLVIDHAAFSDAEWELIDLTPLSGEAAGLGLLVTNGGFSGRF